MNELYILYQRSIWASLNTSGPTKRRLQTEESS